MVGRLFVSNRFFVLISLLLCFFLQGCSSSSITVNGTLTYKGKKAGNCSITLVGSDGNVRTTITDDSGNFSIADVPVGVVKIGLTSLAKTVEKSAMQKAENPNTSSRTGKSAPNGEQQPQSTSTSSVIIDAKYANPESSGLSGTAKANEPFDIVVN